MDEENSVIDEPAIKVGVLLVSASEIVQKILSCMTMVELCRLSTVCRFWYNTFKKLIKDDPKRQKFHYMFLDPRNELNYLNTAQNDKERYLRLCRLFCDSQTSMPGFCFVFNACLDRRHKKNSPRLCNGLEKDFIMAVRKILPYDCPTLHIMSDGMIGTEEKRDRTEILPPEKRGRVKRICKIGSGSQENPNEEVPNKKRRLDDPTCHELWKSREKYNEALLKFDPCLANRRLTHKLHFIVTEHTFDGVGIMCHTLRAQAIPCKCGKRNSLENFLPLQYYTLHDSQYCCPISMAKNSCMYGVQPYVSVGQRATCGVSTCHRNCTYGTNGIKEPCHIPDPPVGCSSQTLRSLPFCFSILTIPNNIPGVKITPIKVKSYPTHTLKTELKFNRPLLVSELYGIPEDEELKALLVFKYHNTTTMLDDLLQVVCDMLVRNNGSLAVAGAIPYHCYARMPTHDVDSIRNIGIAISGSGVSAASLLVGSSVDNIDELRQAYEKLLKFYDPRKRSLAFMFPCVARNERYYRTRNETVDEVQVFRGIFPQTPVFGSYAYGEFCHHFIPQSGEVPNPAEKFDVQPDDYLHSFSISILMLQFDK